MSRFRHRMVSAERSWRCPRAFLREVRKLLTYLPMTLGVLLLTIIPVFTAFAPLGWFLLGAWMMSLQFIDYPMDNHRLPL